MPEIQRVSHTHNAIMDYMLANPGISLGEIAKEFKYTQAWLSQIIHSDAFQAMMREKQGMIFHNTVMSIKEKMTGVAALALDRMVEKVQTEGDLAVLSRTAEGVLDRLGFGSKGVNININQTNNTQVNTLRSELDEARALLGKAERPQIGVVIDESGKQPALPDPSSAAVGQEYLAKGSPVQTPGGKGASAEEGDQA